MHNTVAEFEQLIVDCASNSTLTGNLPQVIPSDYPAFERYYDSKLPAIITKELVKGLWFSKLRNMQKIAIGLI